MKKVLMILALVHYTLSPAFALGKKDSSVKAYKTKIGKFKVWKNENFEYYLQKMDKELIVMKIQSAGGIAALKEIKKLKNNKDTLMIVYFAGSSGSRVEVNHFRIALWSQSKNNFIGDFLYKDVVAETSKVIVESTIKIQKKELQVIRNKRIRKRFELE